MKRIIFSLFFFILLVTPVMAFDCNYFLGYKKEECITLLEENESLISNLVYSSYLYPDKEVIKNYNSLIEVTGAPYGSSYHYKSVIQAAWIDILTIQPSIYFEDVLFVKDSADVRSEYDYSIKVPSNHYDNHKSDGRTCKILYSLDSKSDDLEIYVNDNLQGNGKEVPLDITQDSTIKAELEIQATIKAKEYKWDRYCCSYDEDGCSGYCYDCDYYRTTYSTDTLIVTDNEEVKLYQHEPVANLEFISTYYGSTKARITKENDTNIEVNFNNSFFKDYEYEYSAKFIKEPYKLLQLEAIRQSYTEQNNLIRDGDTFFIKDISDCSIKTSDLFNEQMGECNYSFSGEEIEEIRSTGFTASITLLFRILVFIFINYLIYLGIKKSWGKIAIPLTLLLLFTPMVSAEECGLTNLASCIPEKMYDFFIQLLNAPLQPLLYLTRTLLESPPSIDIFHSIWAIMVYCISMFYGLLFIYSGFQFIFSGHNVLRREMAKEWLKNTVIMIVLVQASFYLYKLALELGSIMTTSVLSMVDEHFFMITADNIVNIGLEFLFVTFYVFILFLTILFLVMRYLVVAFGVIFVPIGIFCYFIPPLRSYGKLILNILGMFVFITFLDGLIILACSMLIDIPIFENIKILVMIACFLIINLLFIILTKHVIGKSSVSDSGEKVAQAVKYIAIFV